jgi:hypothetical protein
MMQFTEKQLIGNARICGLPDDYITILKYYYPVIEKYFSEYHELFYRKWPEKPDNFDDILPYEIAGLGKAATHALYITIILSGVQHSKERYGILGYPLEMWRKIMPDLRLHLRLDGDKCLLHGSSVWWSFDILSGYTIQLGRLQFQKFKFWGDVQGFRGRNSGKIIFLSNEGLKSYKDMISGFPVCNGLISTESISLPAAEYDKFLDNSSDAINIHIPAGQKLDIDACRDSMRRARKFYAAYYPEFNAKGFICLSWLLDFRLQKYLGTDSNIVKFQQLGVLYPYANESNESLQRVFGTTDVTGLKPENRLQYALLDILKRGEKIYAGAIFIDM